jgi:hypothetical protein
MGAELFKVATFSSGHIIEIELFRPTSNLMVSVIEGTRDGVMR